MVKYTPGDKDRTGRAINTHSTIFISCFLVPRYGGIDWYGGYGGGVVLGMGRVMGYWYLYGGCVWVQGLGTW